MIYPKKSDIFSFHFVNSLVNLKLMKEVCDSEYSQKMGDTMGNRNWDTFIHVMYAEEEFYW